MFRCSSVLRLCCLPLFTASLVVATPAQSPAAARDATALVAQLPARLVPNEGQWTSPELYRMQAGGMHVFLERRGWSFWLQEASASDESGAARRRGCHEFPVQRAVALRMEFAGACAPVLKAERPLASVTNYLLGEGVRRTGVPSYGAVLYQAMYPGIDVRFREAAGRCEYDLLLAPGADLAQVRLQVTGAESVTIDASGALVLRTALGAVRQPQPVTWMVAGDGSKHPITCSYVLHGAGCFGFTAPERDLTLALVVDPPILFSTYLGGSGTEEPSQVIEDGTGQIIVCGRTQSLNFPTTPGTIQPTHAGSWDGFITRIDPSQTPAAIVFSTCVGGAVDDWVTSVAILPGGLVAFCGSTTSTNLPVTAGAWQTANAGAGDGFVGVLAANGNVLLGLSYFGGPAADEIGSVNAAPGGELLVAGWTQSSTLPVTPTAFQPVHGGGAWDGFVLRFNLTATSLQYLSYFGGSGDEWLYCWDVDQQGVMTTVSGTSSLDFPVTANAFDTTHNGGGTTWASSDTVVARFNPLLAPAQQLLYATYLGGSGNDWGYMARSTPAGEIVVTGTTTSPNFPTTADAYQTTYRGGTVATNGTVGDAFVVKIDPQRVGSAQLLAATYFGGVERDQGLDCFVEPGGEVTLVGWTHGTANNLPTTPDAMRRSYAANDGHVARFSGDGRQLLYASYFGGSGNDGAWFVARHGAGIATLYGQSYSANVPVQNPVQGAYNGGVYSGSGDAWVARLQLVPSHTQRHGRPTRGNNGWPTIHALGDAVSGNGQFGFACTRAPLGAAGFLVFAWQSTPGVPLFGINVLVDTAHVALSTLVIANAQGECTYHLPIPSMVVPTLHAQFAWLENPALFTLSASDAMRIH